MKTQMKTMGVWTAIGIGVDAAIGAATGQIPLSLSLGAAAGIIIGRQIDKWRQPT